MTKWSFIGVFLIGFFAYAGMNLFFKETNTLEFCTSCHTMEQNLVEYKKTIHYKNHSGVRADCADCHVPKEPLAKIWAKLYAAKDVYHEIIGTIDTPEKFEKHRWEMASRVWDKMKATDSRECRSCHSWDAMMFIEQDKSASKKHQRAKEEGRTCIDCHKGIAHEEPDEPEDEVTEQLTSAVTNTTKAEGKNTNVKSSDATKGTVSRSNSLAPKAPAIPLAPSMQTTDATDAGPLTELVNACNKCHGKDGNSNEAEIPNISKASALYLRDALMAFKSGDRKGDEYKDSEGEVTDMNKLTVDLSEEQFNALGEYYSGKEFISHVQNVNVSMADIGAKIFDKNCEKCHAEGGTDPEDDAGIIAGQPKNYLVKQFSYFSDGSREMPKKMARKFKKLSDEQIQQVIEFLIR